MTMPAATEADQERAFPAYACAERYFASSIAEQARRGVDACVRRGDGPALVIGAPGMGKTMLLEVLASGFEERFGVARLTGSQVCTRRALLQAVLFGLDLPYREREEGELRLSLIESLQDAEAFPNGVAVLVDEAQLLTPRLLEELRVLSNLTRRGEPIVRLVLLGGPALEETFASPELESFNQRIGARAYLSTLTYEETREYVRSHVAAVGADPDEVFTGEGLDAVFHATDGVPRLVSQICDRALRAAVTNSRDQVDAQVVQQAWSDLHQLPAPWTPAEPRRSVATQVAVETSASVVEFGDLAELSDELPHEPLREPIAESPAFPEARIDEQAAVEQATSRQPVWNADEALGIAEPVERAIMAASSPEVADDPFGEEFQEEEIVIDRFSGLEMVFQASTPIVTNTLDPKLSTIAGSFARDEQQDAEADEEYELSGTLESSDHDDPVAEPPVASAPVVSEPVVSEPDAVQPDVSKPFASERRQTQLLRLQQDEFELLDEDDDVLDETLDDTPDERLSTFSIDAPANSGDAPSDRDILVIEDDLVEIEGIKQPMARRLEYRQLFAKLRHG
ncbi:hypothetical protein Pla123a_34200 [Posidoniimonas polymericola]|uniref:ORC1/DEAH AAA+ ATPase domain-containing protein n=1 Tax=Posidoniimonas polymericola TaxID=2528002 RepID=A0A5C5YIA0_9BACT|nr:AAA family ATPase [Posidoniimonas polymericola]TWT74596.1 hypothetical protein Pla123a_34200 [Posidoniimonas polymericola]